ncbi:hypothetical protein Y1Q_0016137 [Alligator mississippiensis]|uniref:Uncharacterized protein n=1 Tax=Alligator mississippiensis TaxID=8496 RepID=A0A151MZ14_ALLMI|nr:hypothetical protein Y1Q_0016137 [Alligator mississippiensis]
MYQLLLQSQNVPVAPGSHYCPYLSHYPEDPAAFLCFYSIVSPSPVAKAKKQNLKALHINASLIHNLNHCLIISTVIPAES